MEEWRCFQCPGLQYCSLMGHAYDAGSGTLPGWPTCSRSSVSGLVVYICLSPHGLSGFGSCLVRVCGWPVGFPRMSFCLPPSAPGVLRPLRIGGYGWPAGCPRALGESWRALCADLRTAPVLRRALTVPVSGLVVPGPGDSWPILERWDPDLSWGDRPCLRRVCTEPASTAAP